VLPGSGRPSYPGPGATPVGPPVPPQIGMSYRPAGVTPSPLMRIQSPVPPSVLSSGASPSSVMPAGLF